MYEIPKWFYCMKEIQVLKRDTLYFKFAVFTFIKFPEKNVYFVIILVMDDAHWPTIRSCFALLFSLHTYPKSSSQKNNGLTFSFVAFSMGLLEYFYILNECLPLCVHQSSIFLLFSHAIFYFSPIIHYFNYFENDLFNYHSNPICKFYEIFSVQLACILLIIFSMDTAISLF